MRKTHNSAIKTGNDRKAENPIQRTNECAITVRHDVEYKSFINAFGANSNLV